MQPNRRSFTIYRPFESANALNTENMKINKRYTFFILLFISLLKGIDITRRLSNITRTTWKLRYTCITRIRNQILLRPCLSASYKPAKSAIFTGNHPTVEPSRKTLATQEAFYRDVKCPSHLVASRHVGPLLTKRKSRCRRSKVEIKDGIKRRLLTVGLGIQRRGGGGMGSGAAR